MERRWQNHDDLRAALLGENGEEEQAEALLFAEGLRAAFESDVLLEEIRKANAALDHYGAPADSTLANRIYEAARKGGFGN